MDLLKPLEKSKSPALPVWWAAWVVLGLAGVLASTLALVPEWRLRVQGLWFDQSRTLLATVVGDLAGDGKPMKVLKFQTPLGVAVEVHEPTGNAAHPYALVDKVMIPDRHDGLFDLHGQATRLAVVDLDGDQQMEIIAPTFDEKLVAHLNALRLNRDSRKLEFVRGSDSP